MPRSTTSFNRSPSPQTVSWLLDLHDSGKLDLDPPYQRRSVWSLAYKQFFIDSVLRNYPTQAIFLELTIDPDAPSIYRVLDGKQRITTLIEFVGDEFPAPPSVSDLKVDGEYYSDFPRDLKTNILRYLFVVEMINDSTNTELNEAFDRLNRNVMGLNRQELRNAQFTGEFIRKMELIAERPLWETLGIVTAARRRRMLDVEYVSEFYIACRDGIQEGKDYLDEVYAANDDAVDRESETDKIFEQAYDYVQAVNDVQPLRETRFTNIADFYSLWSAVCQAIREDSALPDAHAASNRLIAFNDSLEDEASDDAKSYILAARQGSNKKANRQLRAQMLSAALSPEEGI